MALEDENQINLKTLRRVDPSIVEILDNASQVAIYKYERNIGEWESTDVEGTLFLYKRCSHPKHGFIIVNRNSTTNFVECITNDMQFQLQEPYLLYKNHSGCIIGSWFYDHNDLLRISKKIQTIILKDVSTPKRQRCASESDTVTPKREGVDIMSLLTQAHDKYMKTVPENKAFQPKETSGINFDTPTEKRTPNKSISRTRPSPVRSSSQETASPRPRLVTTGSYDPPPVLLPSHLLGGDDHKIQNNFYALDQQLVMQHAAKTEGTTTPPLTPGDFLNPWSTLPTPTRLSPLFHRNEIASPFSDVQPLDESFDLQTAEQLQSWQSECSLWGPVEPKMEQNCDIHLKKIKHVLTQHVEENPEVMLKIHEAYVSSLRSLFKKD